LGSKLFEILVLKILPRPFKRGRGFDTIKKS